MSETVTVIATEAAYNLIMRLKASSGSLRFVQSGGRHGWQCSGLPARGRPPSWPNDLLIGEIAGCPFSIDREQYKCWRNPQFLIDVAQGDGDTFSLEGPEGMHFAARTA